MEAMWEGIDCRSPHFRSLSNVGKRGLEANKAQYTDGPSAVGTLELGNYRNVPTGKNNVNVIRGIILMAISYRT